ncbi:hypothetical protein SAMN06309944_0225 [Micrococcales bacterium KH10]|nr:hypothetical protein SAMN06309944_0225 [Micrococcales bacterium KH10]
MSGKGIYRHRFPIVDESANLHDLKQEATDEMAAICERNCWRRVSPTLVAVEHGSPASIVASVEVLFITKRKHRKEVGA